MATRAITLTLSVRDADTVRRELERIGPAGEEAIRRLDDAAKKAAGGAGGMGGVANAARSIEGALGNLASRAGLAGQALSGFGAAGIAAAASAGGLVVGLTAVARAGDDMVASLGRIRAATGSIESARDVYDQLLRLSLQTGQSIADSAGQFARFAIASKEIGATNAQAVKLVEVMQKAASLGGASAQEASSAALQLGQALASGVLQGEELRSLLENMPNLAASLAKELGVGIGQLRQMGSEGKLTADVVMPALLKAGEQINAEYEKMPVTMSRAFDQLQVSSGNFLARMDQALGLSQRLAASLGAAAKALDGLSSRAFPSAAQSEQSRFSDMSSRADDLRGRIRAAEAEGPSMTAPTGGYQRRAQIVGNRNAGGDLLGEMKEELAAIEREMATSNTNRLAILREGREDQRAEEDDAASRRLENQKRQTEKAAGALRTSLDKDLATRQAYQKRVDEINGLVGKAGGLTEAEGQRLITLATKERDEALKKLAGTQKKVRDEELEGISAIIREQGRAYEQREAAEQRIADNSQQTIDGYREQISLLETEGGLLSSSADIRGRELALIKERLRIQKEGEKDEERIAERLKLVGELYDKNLDFTQRKNSFDELARAGEQAFDRIGNAITQAFADGSLKAIDFGNIAKGVLSEIAQAALRMAIVNPVLNSVFGGSRGTFSGLMGSTALSSGEGSPIVTDGKGNLVGYVQQGAQAYSAYNKLSGLNPSSYINGTSSFATGWGGLDTALNTPLWAGAANAGVNAPGAITNAAGYGSMAQSSIDAAGSASAAGVGTNGLTYGGAAMGALGVAGGLYGAYAGLQRGGPGGYTSAAGGAATAGLSAAAMAGMSVPVYGWVAAAALMVLGALLPGQKPSDRTGAATFQTNDPMNPVIGGLEGVRYSEANREQARAIGAELNKLADSIGQKTGLGRSVETAYRVEVGARDGLNVYLGEDKMHGEMDEEGIKAVTAAFASRMLALAAEQTTDENLRSILNRSGNADPDATLANIDWYENTWKVMQKPLEQTRSGLDTFAIQLEALKAPFQEVIDKSVSLGLATAELAKRQQEAVDYAKGQVAQGYDQASWQAQGRGYIQGLRDIRQNYETNSSLYRSVGRNPEDLYNQQAIAALSSLTVDALRDVATNFVGWDDAMASLAQQMLANTEATAAATSATEAATQTAALNAQNREQAQQNVTGVLGGITDFVQSLQLGDMSTLSPEARMSLASQRFEDLATRAQSGDFEAVSDFTPVAGNLLSAGRDYYASGPGYAALQERVLAVAESISNVSPDTLTSSAMDRIIQTSSDNLGDRIVAAIAELKAENQLLRLQMQGLTAGAMT